MLLNSCHNSQFLSCSPPGLQAPPFLPALILPVESGYDPLRKLYKRDPPPNSKLCVKPLILSKNEVGYRSFGSEPNDYTRPHFYPKYEV